MFDDGIGKDVATEKENEKRKILFDNEDDDDEEVSWNVDKLKTKQNIDEKVCTMRKVETCIKFYSHVLYISFSI